MVNFLVGLLLLYLLLAAIKQFGRVKPATVARVARHGGGVAGLLGALLVLLRGRFGLAATIASAAAAFAGWGKSGGPSAGFRAAGFGGTSGRVSKARSATIEMTLDLDSGAMAGRALAGAFQGRALDSLSPSDLLALLAELRRNDAEGASLLEAYLDRRLAGWRQADQGQADPRRRGGDSMTREEAYEILGLAKGASAAEVVHAHRTLMKKFHPDHGGSTALAARVNQAKDILLQRHG
jgi:hypothetical protein